MPCGKDEPMAAVELRFVGHVHRDPKTVEKSEGDAEAGPDRACRRPKRRTTSEMVTKMEMMMRTMMIQVWSVDCC